MQKHPKAKQYQTKTLPGYAELNEIYGGKLASATFAQGTVPKGTVPGNSFY